MGRGHGRVVDRQDDDRDGRGARGQAAAVAHGEGERIIAVVVGVWRVGEIGRATRERAMRGLRDDSVGERVAIHVGAGQGNADAAILLDGDLLGRGHGRVVDRVHGDRDNRWH